MHTRSHKDFINTDLTKVQLISNSMLSIFVCTFCYEYIIFLELKTLELHMIFNKIYNLYIKSTYIFVAELEDVMFERLVF